MNDALEQAILDRLAEIEARLAKLEEPQHPGLSDPDPCADGFCPVSLFRPIDETEGSA